MKWVPPIPAEKLYSPPALALGPALAMLVWCYDDVARDGTIKIDLNRAMQDMGKPYRTIKDWWRTLRAGPFFVAVRDRGRLGYEATFHRDWIEWRVMFANYPMLLQGRDLALEGGLIEGQDSALEFTAQIRKVGEGLIFALEESLKPLTPIVQGQDSALDVVAPVEGALVQGQDLALEASVSGKDASLKDSSRPDEGQDSALGTSAYKVLMTLSDHVVCDASDDASADRAMAEQLPIAKPKAKRTRRTTEVEPPTPIEVRQAIAKGSTIDLDTGLGRDIAQVNDIAKHLWTKVRSADQTIESFVKDIRNCGRWIRQTQHPYKGTAQRIPPSALVKFWASWRESLPKPQNGTPALNGIQLRAPSPAVEELATLSDADLARRRAETAAFARANPIELPTRSRKEPAR